MLLVVVAASWMRGNADVKQDAAPTLTADAADDSATETGEVPRTRESSIAEVLELANKSMDSMRENLVDYTARFVKQDRSEGGQLNEKTEMDVKIQSTLRNESDDAPMRIYLKFHAPEATAGREVIWGKDLYDGKMAVHEVTLLLSWKTVWLDPTGMLAMAGQRYPVYEIGIVKLVDKLIERGNRDLDNPDVSVTITRDHEYDGIMCDLIQAKRAKPGGGEDDFSLAEIVYDPQRLLILSYRSFGWPKQDAADQTLPLVESYEYHDLKINVGLSDKDFDVQNESYAFP